MKVSKSIIAFVMSVFMLSLQIVPPVFADLPSAPAGNQAAEQLAGEQVPPPSAPASGNNLAPTDPSGSAISAPTPAVNQNPPAPAPAPAASVSFIEPLNSVTVLPASSSPAGLLRLPQSITLPVDPYSIEDEEGAPLTSVRVSFYEIVSPEGLANQQINFTNEDGLGIFRVTIPTGQINPVTLPLESLFPAARLVHEEGETDYALEAVFTGITDNELNIGYYDSTNTWVNVLTLQLSGSSSSSVTPLAAPAPAPQLQGDKAEAPVTAGDLVSVATAVAVAPTRPDLIAAGGQALNQFLAFLDLNYNVDKIGKVWYDKINNTMVVADHVHTVPSPGKPGPVIDRITYQGTTVYTFVNGALDATPPVIKIEQAPTLGPEARIREAERLYREPAPVGPANGLDRAALQAVINRLTLAREQLLFGDAATRPRAGDPTTVSNPQGGNYNVEQFAFRMLQLLNEYRARLDALPRPAV